MKQPKKIFAVFDSETCTLVGGVYDVSLVICDRKGNILHKVSYLVREIVTDAKKMMGAYYAGKTFSHYIPALDANLITLKSWLEIRDEFNRIIADFNATVFCAYNLGFDARAVAKTHEQLGHGGKWLIKKLDLLCLWEFSCLSIFQQSTYKLTARQMGWISDAGNIRTNAECAYRYISTRLDFAENHTALDDAIIEAEILARCLATRKAIPYNVLNGKTWRHVNV